VETKDIAALREVISDDYMAMNFESKLSDKENEIARAKTDAGRRRDSHHRIWKSHDRVRSSVCTGKASGRDHFQRESAVLTSLSKTRRVVETRRNPVNADQTGATQPELMSKRDN